MNRFAELCFALLLTASVVLAQTGNAGSKAQELRAYQLRVLRGHVLARTLESINKMEEPGLRLSARNQMLTYLATEKASSENKQVVATALAVEALADLREHGEELLPFMFSYLSNDLRSWIQKHRPDLTKEFDKAVTASAKTDASQHIRSLFELEAGDVLAAKRIRQELKEQGELNGLKFWLDELMKRKSKEFEPLASHIVDRATQGQLSFETLFWISDIYLRPQTPDAVRNRFLTMVVARTQPAHFVAEPAPQMAYDLLTEILPFVQRSLPNLYDQALNQHLAMRAALTERQRTRDAQIQRLKDSANPIEDLVSAAEAAKSKTERNELLLQAAQLALEKKRFDVCLEILGGVDVETETPPSDTWQRSIDQFLKNFIRTVLIESQPDLAEKASGRIGSPLTRVEALNLIVIYYAKATENAQAQRLLSEASKVAASAPDETPKAKSYFILSITCEQVDSSKKADLLLSGINTLNNLARANSSGRDKTIYQNYVLSLDNSGYEMTKAFNRLTKQDENSALALVDKLQKQDLRTFALLGILSGLDGLLREGGPATNVPK